MRSITGAGFVNSGIAGGGGEGSFTAIAIAPVDFPAAAAAAAPWLPAGFSLLAGTYPSPYFSFSSSWIKSIYASMIASSCASSASAFVRVPFLAVSSTIPRPRSVPLAHPFAAFARRVAASAITRRISSPRRTGAPPSFWPEPAVSVRRFSAAMRARRWASCRGIRPPPSLWPAERKPSPV